MAQPLTYEERHKNWCEKLDKEYEFYLSLSDEWKKRYHDRHVIIRDQKIQGIYYCFQDAYLIAVETLGHSRPFLLHKVGEENKPQSWVCHPIGGGGEICHPI